MSDKLRVGVVGATGYVGSELCRWLLANPHLELVRATSRRGAGQPLGLAVPALFGVTDLVLEDLDASLAELDAVFMATTHGVAAPIAELLASAPILVDCSRDHRHVPGWVYGQPEWNAEALLGATRIAAPGCFASAIELSLAPLVKAGVVQGDVMISAATGSAGSGSQAKPATHHPERFANIRAYKVLEHQHVPEARSFLQSLGGQPAPRLHFVPLSAPVDRGIFATSFVHVGEADASAIVNDAYASHPLVRLRSGSPDLRLVRGTAFCDLSVHQDGDTAVVMAAIDNLGRGAAAQAIGALLTSLGHPPHAGLLTAGLTP